MEVEECMYEMVSVSNRIRSGSGVVVHKIMQDTGGREHGLRLGGNWADLEISEWFVYEALGWGLRSRGMEGRGRNRNGIPEMRDETRRDG